MLALYAAPPLLDAGIQQSEALALITELLNSGDRLPLAALYLLRDLATKKTGLEKENISSFCISADGRRMAFDAGFNRGTQLELWVMENFPPRINAAR